MTAGVGAVGRAAAAVAELRRRMPSSAIAAAAEMGPLPVENPEDVWADLRSRRAAARAAAWGSTVPVQYADADLAGLALEQKPGRMREWLDSTALTLFLAGPTGVGKTHAAWAVGRAAVDEGMFVRGWSQNGYLAALRPGGAPVEPWQIRDRAIKADLLIFDDLGAEMSLAATDFARTELVELFDARLNARRRQVLTTNLHPGKLVEFFGDRIVSRLRDWSVAVRVEGHDRRRATADW